MLAAIGAWAARKLASSLLGSLLARWWKLALIGFVAIAIVGTLIVLKLQRDHARAELAIASRDLAIYQEANRRTAESFRRYQALAEHQQQILARDAAAARARASQMADIAAEIAHVTQANPPVGPRQQLVFERLRALQQRQAAGD